MIDILLMAEINLNDNPDTTEEEYVYEDEDYDGTYSVYDNPDKIDVWYSEYVKNKSVEYPNDDPYDNIIMHRNQNIIFSYMVDDPTVDWQNCRSCNLKLIKKEKLFISDLMGVKRMSRKYPESFLVFEAASIEEEDYNENRYNFEFYWQPYNNKGIFYDLTKERFTDTLVDYYNDNRISFNEMLNPFFNSIPQIIEELIEY